MDKEAQTTVNEENKLPNDPEVDEVKDNSEVVVQGTKPKWLNITAFLDEVSAEMDSQKLIHTEEFTLLEAMSALEIMDPKMDSGMYASKIKTYEEVVQLKLLPKASQLSVPQVIGIIDKLLCLEVMWFNGFSLAQTMFTCYYLFEPSDIDNPILHSYVQTLLKRTHYIRDSCMKAENYEEEDFSSHLFGLNLHPEIDDRVIEESLKNIEKDLTLKQNRVEGKLNAEDASVAPLQNEESKEADYVKALNARIKFTKNFFQIWKFLDKPECAGLPAASKLINSTFPLINTMKATSHLGLLPDNVFEYDISRRILGGSPPRKIEQFSQEKTFQQLESFFNHLGYLCNIKEYNTLYLIKRFFYEISDLNTTSVIRSKLFNLVYHQGKFFGKFSMVDTLKENATNLFQIPKVYFTKYKLIDSFLSELGKVHIRTLRVTAMNKARQRRKYTRLLEEWSIITSEVADNIDAQIAAGENPKSKVDTQQPLPHYFGIWVLDSTLGIMIRYLQLGFDLELYNPHEYFMIFWYIDNLYSQRTQSHYYILEYNEKSVKRGKKKQANNAKKLKKPPKMTPYQIELQVEQTLCRAIVRFIAALLMSGKIKEPEHKFGSTESLFYRRFQPFQRLGTPRPYVWQQYKQTLDFSKLKVDEVLDGAKDSFGLCKTHIEKLLNNKEKPPSPVLAKELKNMLRVCIANTVQLTLTKSTNKHKNPASVVTFDFSAHRFFPILTLK
eukprot:TRINITY_DN3737_c0_g1_i2.p1 TRINITY_DN3737_c0_g1~~TRINITY_DN3737_c0_g1_i2.p1  ORF type:complete len:737 (-),score=145.60 TRINITY_DN3737_c0_g1_i2:74-2245(-)